MGSRSPEHPIHRRPGHLDSKRIELVSKDAALSKNAKTAADVRRRPPRASPRAGHLGRRPPASSPGGACPGRTGRGQHPRRCFVRPGRNWRPRQFRAACRPVLRRYASLQSRLAMNDDAGSKGVVPRRFGDGRWTNTAPCPAHHEITSPEGSPSAVGPEPSGLRVHSEYSLCSAAMGCTAAARRMVRLREVVRLFALLLPPTRRRRSVRSVAATSPYRCSATGVFAMIRNSPGVVPEMPDRKSERG